MSLSLITKIKILHKIYSFQGNEKTIENDNFIECTKYNLDLDKEFLGVIDEMAR